MLHRSKTVAAAMAVAALLSALAVASASAAAGLTVKKVSPASGPEFSGIPVKIHGSGFSTTPGATTISFGSEPAAEVKCSSTKLCTAITPLEAEGTVPVTATVGSTTSTGSATFTYVTYSPPTVDILSTHKGAAFAKRKLVDRYPGFGTPGNDYVQISNSTATAQTFTGPTGPVTLEPGSTEGYNIPVNESTPYVFELMGTASPKKTLTVRTKTPR